MWPRKRFLRRQFGVDRDDADRVAVDGDKATQAKDIQTALKLAREL